MWLMGQHPAVLTPEFEALRALATRMINDHVDDHGLCAVCGCAFPCKPGRAPSTTLTCSNGIGSHAYPVASG